MPRFSAHFETVRDRLQAGYTLTSPTHALDELVRSAESRGGLEAEEAASLLALGRNPNARAELHQAARELRARVAGNWVEFIIPEYLTSFCQNDCLYCGYRKTNPLAERVRLTLGDYERELDLILSWGHRQIELVLADDAEFGAEQLRPFVALTRDKLQALGGGLVALNAPPYGEADYRRLREAGLDWVALWQETYDQAHFDRWHFMGSPKRHFEFRLDVWDRAIAAGFDRVALGVLFGLYDWRFDVLALVEHGNYLRRTYGLEPYALGIPRLKPARGVLASQKPSRFAVSDDDYRLAVSVYHLAFPRTRLFFNTREPYEFNLALVAGGDLFTVDCETLPGAYLRGRLPGQFATHAYPPRGEVVAALEQRGFTCRFLAPEARPVPASQPGQGAEVSGSPRADTLRWAEEHAEIRARLAEWESALQQLPSLPPAQSPTASGELRALLHYFETVVVEHCRWEEAVLFPAQTPGGTQTTEVASLRDEHERFGIDLDRFARQITSYEQSGDPTVLVTLGGRMIREFRRHLEQEEQFLLV